MKYITSTGICEVIDSSKENKTTLVVNNSMTMEGKVVLCDPAPTDINNMNVVSDPIGAVLVFYKGEEPTPSFISGKIEKVIA